MGPEQPTTIDLILVEHIYNPLPRSQNLELSPNINYFFI